MFDLTPFDRMSRNFVSYDPFREMEELEKRFFGRSTPMFQTDIRETESAYILESNLPGFSKEDIHAEIKANTLTIYAEHKAENDSKDEKNNYIRRERSYGSFRRSFDIRGIEADAISASYRDGVLTLTLPKKEEKQPEIRTLDIS